MDTNILKYSTLYQSENARQHGTMSWEPANLRHHELLQQRAIVQLARQVQGDKPGLPARFVSSLGQALINAGQKLKTTTLPNAAVQNS